MKRTLAVLIALITVIVCLPVSHVNADPAPVYTITASAPAAVVPQQTFTVRYTLTNSSCSSGIAGGSLAVTFDNQVFAFVSASVYSAPANWTIEDWTAANLTGIVYLTFWDETDNSNSIALNGSASFDLTFSVLAGVESQYSAIEIVEEYQFGEGEDPYYTEILDAESLDPVEGTYGSVSIYVLCDIELTDDSEYEIVNDDEAYNGVEDDYYYLDTVHLENEDLQTATTLEEFLDNIKYPEFVKVYDDDDEELTDDEDELATGFTVKLINPNTQLPISEKVIVIKGDISGDGIVTAKDLMKLNAHLSCDLDNPVKVSQYYLTGAYYLAGLMSNQSEILTRDFIRLAYYLSQV